MAGHSKWKNIKHKKALVDAKKAKKFTRITKEITVAAKIGGGDTSTNPSLRLLIQKANEINMPKENYTRAIKRGTGEIKGGTYEYCLYEGYGPENISIIVEVLTDNKNRAINDLREAFNHNGGRITDNGCVSWMFERTGLINGIKENINEEELLELLIDFEIINIEVDENDFIIICNPNESNNIKTVLIDNNYKIEEINIGYYAKDKIILSELQQEKVSEFLQNLESIDDVQNVYTNI